MKQEIPLRVQKEYEIIQAHLRKIFPSQLTTIATVTGVDDTRKVVAVDFSDERSKEYYSLYVKGLVKKTQATMVSFFSESWYLESMEDYEKYKKDLKKYKYSMGNYPGAKEAVWISIQTMTGDWAARISILKSRALGEPEALTKLDKLTGRFNFFE